MHVNIFVYPFFFAFDLYVSEMIIINCKVKQISDRVDNGDE